MTAITGVFFTTQYGMVSRPFADFDFVDTIIFAT